MRTRLASLAVCSVLSIAGPILIGCTPNEAYRTALPASCATPNCGDAPDTFIEKHDGYDLAYVEFTERGNVFDREEDEARPGLRGRAGTGRSERSP